MARKTLYHLLGMSLVMLVLVLAGVYQVRFFAFLFLAGLIVLIGFLGEAIGDGIREAIDRAGHVDASDSVYYALADARALLAEIARGE